jgi:RimJ/RimL family protein N-acetyltransferase
VSPPEAPTLETPRLLLVAVPVDVARAVLAGDLSSVRAAPGWPHAGTPDALRPHAEHGGDGVPGPWLVALRDTDQVIGDCGWYGPPGAEGAVEIGYGLSPAYRNHGYGTEAVRAYLGWVAAQPGVRLVRAETEATNVASRRLLERLAFTVTEVDGATVRYARPIPRLSAPGGRAHPQL